MDISLIQLWHERARPEPDQKGLNAQLGNHIEEFCEMLECVTFFDGNSHTVGPQLDCYLQLKFIADPLKKQRLGVVIHDRKGMLDSLADQVVTSVGVGHCAQMDVVQACDRVNASNWSKFDEHGQPIFDEGGKVIKGPRYVEPYLTGLY